MIGFGALHLVFWAMYASQFRDHEVMELRCGSGEKKERVQLIRV